MIKLEVAKISIYLKNKWISWKKPKKENKATRLKHNYTNIKNNGFSPLILTGIGAASALASDVQNIVSTIKDKSQFKREKKDIIVQ